MRFARAFDLLMLNADDMRRKPFLERKAALRKLLRRDRGASNTSNTLRGTARRCLRRFANLDWKASSQRG
jgi:ATP-dependent DNA ligase